MLFELIGNQQIMCLNTIFVFNDSRDKEKADFILRRIISPYASYNQNNNKKYEETKEHKDENNNYNNNCKNNNTNIINNPLNFDTIFESESNLNSFPLIYQYMKKDDQIELKDDYEVNNNNPEKNVQNNPIINNSNENKHKYDIKNMKNKE